MSSDTIVQWIRTILQQSGVDTSMYSAHSTRAASSSVAATMGCPIDDILFQVDWSNAKTFAKFYNKETVKTCEKFDVKVLDSLLRVVA